MKNSWFLLTGIIFGIVLTQAEVISWYRIQEMFRFDAFHMYGVIGTAVVTGALLLGLLRRMRVRTLEGSSLFYDAKQFSISRYLFGGIIFGLGWALTGACPGPLYILVGNGYLIMLVPLISAILGTFVYGLVRKHLPH